VARAAELDKETTVSAIVPTDEIEGIVGAERHEWAHIGRAVSEEQRVYILHSKDCINEGVDLRRCEYSEALDAGIVLSEWEHWEDQPVWLCISDDGRLGSLPMSQP